MMFPVLDSIDSIILMAIIGEILFVAFVLR